jgi:hypothetical protein
MHTGNIKALCFASGLIILWAGCSDRQCITSALAVPPTVPAQAGGACVHDADCRQGLCDRGTCWYWNRTYAGLCGLPDPKAPPEERLPERLCSSGYLCLDGRCRSCRSDADCQAYFGVGKCTIIVDPLGRKQGAACLPNTTRRAEGLACARDADCRSLFCDRGTCAETVDVGGWNYGGGPCKPGPPHAPEDNIVTSAGYDVCAGYVCVDQRCRSCVSDTECQTGSRAYKCLPYFDLPGKRCGDPNDPRRSPGAPQPMLHPGKPMDPNQVNVPSKAPTMDAPDE